MNYIRGGDRNHDFNRSYRMMVKAIKYMSGFMCFIAIWIFLWLFLFGLISKPDYLDCNGFTCDRALNSSEWLCLYNKTSSFYLTDYKLRLFLEKMSIKAHSTCKLTFKSIENLYECSTKPCSYRTLIALHGAMFELAFNWFSTSTVTEVFDANYNPNEIRSAKNMVTVIKGFNYFLLLLSYISYYFHGCKIIENFNLIINKINFLTVIPIALPIIHPLKAIGLNINVQLVNCFIISIKMVIVVMANSIIARLLQLQ